MVSALSGCWKVEQRGGWTSSACSQRGIVVICTRIVASSIKLLTYPYVFCALIFVTVNSPVFCLGKVILYLGFPSFVTLGTIVHLWYKVVNHRVVGFQVGYLQIRLHHDNVPFYLPWIRNGLQLSTTFVPGLGDWTHLSTFPTLLQYCHLVWRMEPNTNGWWWFWSSQSNSHISFLYQAQECSFSVLWEHVRRQCNGSSSPVSPLSI